jgi:signal transduction histidine kinase
MTRRRVEWLAILLPAVTVGLFEFVRHDLVERVVQEEWGNAFAAVLVGATVFGFVRYFTGAVARTEAALGRARAEAAVLAERQRIGREMHDGIAQALFLLRVRLDEAQAALAAGDQAVAAEALAAGAANVREADAGVRAAIAGLKQASSGEDTAEALRRDIGDRARALGIDLDLALDALPRFDAQRRAHLAAIVQEALSNAARHGGATRVSVAGGARGVVIADNGRGFTPAAAASGGFGLVIMAERARLLGGTLAVEPGEGRGTRVRLSFDGADA